MRKKKEIDVEGFVKWELELFRSECNFTSDESLFFELRNEGDGMTFEKIAEETGYGMTKVNDLSNSVFKKIKKVLPLKEEFLKKYRDKYGE